MDDINSKDELNMAFLLSQMVDGELNLQETQAMVSAMSKSKGLRRKWRLWHLIREALQSEEIILQAKKPQPVNRGGLSAR